jgi:DMSO reductase anchor subunit
MKAIRSALDTFAGCCVLIGLITILWLCDLDTKIRALRKRLIDDLFLVLAATAVLIFLAVAHLDEKWRRYRNTKQVGQNL